MTAAYELLKDSNKYQVTILEKSDEIGGISKTIKYKDYRMDIGGHRFFSKDKSIMNFWKELMPIQGKLSYDDKKLNRKKELNNIGPDPEKDDEVMLIRNRVSRIYYLKKLFNYPISLNFKTLKNLGIKNTFLVGMSYLKVCFTKKEEKNLEDFYINRFGKKLYKMFFEKYTEKLWGRVPSKISKDWGAQRVKGISIKEVIKNAIWKNNKKETSLIEEFWYPKYGPGQLWEILAKKIEEMGGRIEKNAIVEKLCIENEKISKIEYKENGEVKIKDADIVFSTMPLKDLVLGIQDNNKNEVDKLAESLPYRDFITIGVLVDELNLKNETKIETLGNIIPDCWIYVQDANVKMCRLQIFNNWSPYLVKEPEKNIWIGLEYICSKEDEIWKMNEENFKEYAITELEKIGIIEKEKIKDYHIEKVEKAYPAYFDSYSEIEKIRKYLDRFENLYCIGRNGQHRYNNMDHSMMTAIEAVKNIKESTVKKDNVWNVNIEKEYQEG